MSEGGLLSRIILLPPFRRLLGGSLTPYHFSPDYIIKPSFGYDMAGKKPVDKVSKGLTSLVDEFTSAVKEMVNAGEETVVHLAVGGGRVISAVVDATGEVTKVGIETAGNVVGTIGSSVAKVVTGQAGKEPAIKKPEKEMESE